MAEGDLERAGHFFPLLPEVLADPYEVWLAFEQSKTTGRIALRLRYIKVFKQGLLGRKGMLFVANARAGVLEGTLAMTFQLSDGRQNHLFWQKPGGIRLIPSAPPGIWLNAGSTQSTIHTKGKQKYGTD